MITPPFATMLADILATLNNEHWMDRLEEAEAIIAELRSEGLMIVPIHPTDTMKSNGMTEAHFHRFKNMAMAEGVYQAMTGSKRPGDGHTFKITGGPEDADS